MNEIFGDLTLINVFEIISSLLGLVFLLLIIKEKIAAWGFGIAASAINIYLMFSVKLYSEIILYTFYLLMGIYGWISWSSKNKKSDTLKISIQPLKKHLLWIFIGIFLSAGLGYYFDNYSDAQKPYFDSTSTVFAFIATFLEARKVLHAWIYWIILNTYTVFLYYDASLKIRSAEMIIYAVFSFVGLYQWHRSYQKQNK